MRREKNMLLGSMFAPEWWVHRSMYRCRRPLGTQVRGHCLLLHLQPPGRELTQLRQGKE